MSILTKFKRGIATSVYKFLQGSNRAWESGMEGYEQDFGRVRPTNYQSQIDANIGWVYACNQVLADTCSSFKLRLYGKQHNKKIVEIEEHRFLDMWKKVNPWMNSYEMQNLVWSYLNLTGNSYLYVPKNGLEAPAELWVLPTPKIKIVPDEKTFIRGYKWENNQKPDFAPDEIIHFKYPNPNDLWYGLGILMAAAYASDAQLYMGKYQINVLAKQGRPDAILTSEDPIKQREKNRLQADWMNRYGGVENVGKPAILYRMKYAPIGLSPKELGFLASEGMNRDKILGIFGVPLSLLGLTKDYNRANIVGAEYGFMKHRILSKLKMFEEKLNEKLIPMFDDRLFVKYDNPVPEDLELILKERESNLQTGFHTINWEKEKANEPPVPYGDTPIMPMTMVPLGSAPAMPAPKTSNIMVAKELTESERDMRSKGFVARITPQEKAYKRELARYFKRQGKIVLSNLNKLKSKKTIKDEALINFILFATSEEIEMFKQASQEYIQNAYEAGALSKIVDLNLGISFDIYNPSIQQWIEMRISETASEVVKNSADQLTEILQRSIAEGESIEEMAAKIKEVYGENFEKWRAARIARTEIVGASNRSYIDIYEEAGIEEKEWLSAMDEKVRISPWNHNIREKVKIHETFKETGQPLNHPGDRQGSPGNIINCRCTMLP